MGLITSSSELRRENQRRRGAEAERVVKQRRREASRSGDGCVGVTAARDGRRGSDRGWEFAQLTEAARDEGRGRGRGLGIRSSFASELTQQVSDEGPAQPHGAWWYHEAYSTREQPCTKSDGKIMIASVVATN